MFFLVVITLRVLGCYQPRTPISEIIPHYKSNTPSIFTRKLWTQSGHSKTIGCILVLLPWTVLPRPSLVHEFFSVWARLTSSFQHHVAWLERQLWSRACILYIDPITCHFVIPLLVAVVVWLHPLETSRQMCRITFNTLTSSEMSTVFMMRNTLLALDDFYYHRQHPWLPFHRELVHIMNTTCSPASVVFCLEVLPSFLSRMFWGLLHLLEILGMMILLTITILLGPGVAFNQDTNMLTMLFEVCTSINPIALKLTIDSSFLDCWLLIRHSNVDLAT